MSVSGGRTLSPRVLVAGIGNLFCGDDGFGPEVVRRLVASDRLPRHVRAVDYGIRGMHLAYDLLDGYDALVIVDAVPGAGEPGDICVLEVGEDDLGSAEFDPHGMAPVAVLASLKDLGGRLPPTYVIGCRPADTGEGIGLSAPVEAAIPVAIDTVRAVLRERIPVPTVAENGAC
ncbi:MAG: hydrogenase maturation protease [Marmoricola sp.]